MVLATGPVVVCVDKEENVETLTDCGVALAQLWGAPLLLAAVVVVPTQLPLYELPEALGQPAVSLLERARERAGARGLAGREEIWPTRDWRLGVERMTNELGATALVMGRGHGRRWTLLRRPMALDTGCPTIQIDGNDRFHAPDWPPSWLAEVNLNFGG
jgi:hypothetical protein